MQLLLHSNKIKKKRKIPTNVRKSNNKKNKIFRKETLEILNENTKKKKKETNYKVVCFCYKTNIK